MEANERLIDANALLERMNVVTADDTCPLHIAAEVDQEIALAPTVDAVEVVRCGECRFCDTVECPMSRSPGRVSANDFCSYGEKRDV